ncbi:3'-5' exoribonuclease YhaM family protein [Pyramidobacter piscolens]|uniref:3'-5' exoribonuclease YhaM family protein n=1 Tax=Pyramidobacter piscolens TaxID=638849 RepID=UPI003AB1436E
MSNKTLAEVRALPVDSKFQSVGLITELKEKRDKNDKPYWIMSVMDKSGVLDAKVWGNAQWFDLKDGVKKEISEPSSSPLVQNLKGETVGLIGSITEFKGKPQYQFNQIWLVDQEREEYRPAAFIRASGVPVDRLEAEFWQLVNGCGNEAGEFLRFVFQPDSATWQAFRTFPAAVAHHHAYLHGLLEHTLGVARSAQAIARSYQGTAYEPDLDIVVAGALLHDLGKLDTYALDPGPESTLEGTVLDHIATGYARFVKLADEFTLTPLTRTLLAHIILSHHGQKEFGSPVLPATPEAMIVAAADNLDFCLNSWHGAVEQLDGGMEADRAISDFDFSMQRRLWKWRPEQPR